MNEYTQIEKRSFYDITTCLSEIKHLDGQKTIYETAYLSNWTGIMPIQGKIDNIVLSDINRLFMENILPGKKIEGPIVIFIVPDGMKDPFPETTSIGNIFKRDCRIRYWLSRLYEDNEVRIENEKLVFYNSEYQAFWDSLEKKGCIFISALIEGIPTFLPVCRHMFKLSTLSKDQIVCNSHYFQMEITDCATPWDIMGTPIGLLVHKEKTLLPPLYERETLVIKYDGTSSIERPDIRDQVIFIGNQVLDPKNNCEIFTRPYFERTLADKALDLVVVGKNLLGINRNGNTEIPEGGFVIRSRARIEIDSTEVKYGDVKDVLFAVQAGPALVIEGKPAKDFGSPFWKGMEPAYPPTVFPLDWANARAARLALGSKNNKPMIIWVEGPSKSLYLPGLDSCGASLGELSEICFDLQVENMINLDGGGSAQICIDGHRRLKVSDRNQQTCNEAERPIPLGLSFPLKN